MYMLVTIIQYGTVLVIIGIAHVLDLIFISEISLLHGLINGTQWCARLFH